jgi:hypothetical protein
VEEANRRADRRCLPQFWPLFVILANVEVHALPTISACRTELRGLMPRNRTLLILLLIWAAAAQRAFSQDSESPSKLPNSIELPQQQLPEDGNGSPFVDPPINPDFVDVWRRAHDPSTSPPEGSPSLDPIQSGEATYRIGCAVAMALCKPVCVGDVFSQAQLAEMQARCSRPPEQASSGVYRGPMPTPTPGPAVSLGTGFRITTRPPSAAPIPSPGPRPDYDPTYINPPHSRH